MNGLTSALMQTYEPRLAIIAYGIKDEDRWHDCYLESHVINDKGQLLEGKPLRQETLDGIVDVFFDERQNRTQMSGMIPENLLQYDILPGGNYSMMWWQPAQVKQLFFANELHIPNGKAWVPALVYKVERKNLSVFAIIKDKRPDERTDLWKAPFHNVASDGKVCLGNASVKKPSPMTFTSVMKYWEDLFWLSEFSHLNGSDNPTKSNLTIIWKRLLKNNKLTWSQLDELKPMKKTTLKSLIEE